tara:strand:+ start:135 stop:443 length:309 start_codon:yes stop_codon:yes gene_type:complete
MGICMLLFLVFLFGSTKDWQNSSKSHNQQMGFTGDTQTIWPVAFLKAHGSLVSHDLKNSKMQQRCHKIIMLKPGAGHTGFYVPHHRDVKSLRTIFTTFDEIR